MAFGSVLKVLQAKMKWAMPYGWFHILSLVLSVAAGVWLTKRYKAPTEQQVRRVLLVTAIGCLVLEVYKQVVYSCYFDGDVVRFRYQWFVFPFQFCSTPMYIGLLAGLTHGKRHERFAAYLASYAVFAGLSVMVWPTAVLTDMIGVNVQTMVCHGSMISIGIFLLCSGYVKTDFATFKKGVPVFVTVFLMAVAMNEVAYRLGVFNYGEFNMFYLSPYGQSAVPVLAAIQKRFSSPVPQLAYLVLFSVIAYLMMLMFRGINGAIVRVKREQNTSRE